MRLHVETHSPNPIGRPLAGPLTNVLAHWAKSPDVRRKTVAAGDENGRPSR
jgi:hypothetical protein